MSLNHYWETYWILFSLGMEALDGMAHETGLSSPQGGVTAWHTASWACAARKTLTQRGRT